MTPGKLEVSIKINALPTDVTTAPNGWKTFGLDCSGRTVTMTLKPKMFAKLEVAARDWPMWVAAISGQLGASTANGFELLEPNVQTFEKKPKASPAPAEVK